MSTVRARFREELLCKFIPAGSDDAVGALFANFPELEFLWGDGTSDDQANRWWCDASRSVLTAADDDLDLRALPNGPGGTAVLLAEVRALLIVASRANTTILTMKPAVANGWTGLGATMLHDLRPGQAYRMFNPVDGKHPTGAADKVLRITNAAGATATYAILAIGTGS